MLRFLDTSFFVFHTCVVVFILTGWAWSAVRRIHLLVVTATCLSWFGFGLFYGFGYCPLTDWHWQVKRALGETALPNSYVKYYLDGFTGIEWNPIFVDATVALLGLTALALSAWLSWRDRLSNRTAVPRRPHP